MHVYELAIFFREHGHAVTVGSFVFGDFFLDQFKKNGIDFLDLKKQRAPLEWDVIWTHHVTCFYEIHAKRRMRAKKFIHGILSVIVPVELPPFSKAFSPGAKFFSLYANSAVTRDFVLERVGPDVDVQVLRNLAPEKWNIHGSVNVRALRRLAVVSNHVPDEVRQLESRFQAAGLSIVFIGGRGARVEVTPESLNGFDAVITIGKTVQYCLAIGIPVFLYDYFGGAGWLSAENIARAEYFNYNGKCTGKKYSAAELFELVLSGYPCADQFSQKRVAWARERYGISSQLNGLGFWDHSDVAFELVCNDIDRRDVADVLKKVKVLAFKKKWSRRLGRWKARFGLA